MYLVLGNSHDLCCTRVHAAFEASGRRAVIVGNPLIDPARFAWRLDEDGVSIQWSQDEAHAEPIEGVLVRGGGWLDPDGWQPHDFAYMQAEVHAALLAWLHGLPCPVVNRYSADLWYRPQVSLLAWHHLLRACGLTTTETIVSNVEAETRAFAQRADAGGIVYAPLTSEAQYLVATDDEWAGLTTLQRRTPVCLTLPHAAAHLVCVVDGRVVWNEPPGPDAAKLAPALRRLAAESGLTFVECALAPTAEGLAVVAIDHHPRLERYREAAQREIVDALVHALTSGSIAAADRQAACEARS